MFFTPKELCIFRAFAILIHLKIIESHDDVQGDPVLLEARSVVRRKYSLQVPGSVSTVARGGL
jgi:hypothetical protein